MTEVKNLSKKYGDVTAVKDVSFTLETGHVYGLLGPNGAGKSTTMNIMTGCLSATDGTVTVNGLDIYENAVAAKSRIGYLPEIPPLYTDMTPSEYLAFIARAKKYKGNIGAEIGRVSDLCGVTPVKDRLIKYLSKGYRQRVGIAGALIGDPEIVILDEPTVGLDPAQIIEIRRLISSLREGHTVVLSSHIMSEIAAVCDHIIIMSHGKIVASGTPDELEAAYKGHVITAEFDGDTDAAKEAILEITGVTSVECRPHGGRNVAVIETEEGLDLRGEVFRALAGTGCTVFEYTSSSVSLEDIFLKLTEDRIEEPAPEVVEEPSDAPSEEHTEGPAEEEPAEQENRENGGDEA